MFQIETFTEARLATLTSRVEKHGDDDKPAVSLGVEIEAPNTILDSIDPNIRLALFKPKPDAEPELPDVEVSTPILRCNSIDRVTLPTKHEGWTLAVDDGIDDTKPLTFGGCKVDKFNVEPRQGGSITLRFRIGTSDLDAERSGMLGMHVGQPIWITLRKPEKAPDAPTIDGSTEAFKADHPEADLFHAGADDLQEPGPFDEGYEPDDTEGGAPDAGAGPAEPQRGENWPFGTRGETEPGFGETVGAVGETPDDGAAEQRELEAGMATAIAKSGVKAKRGRARA